MTYYNKPKCVDVTPDVIIYVRKLRKALVELNMA
jgi:hypothetical protein